MDARGPDAELRDDVIGVASARLHAAGLTAGERMGALRLLSVLLTLADEGGRIRRPLSMVASEFDLPGPEARRSLAHLVDAGVVAAVDDGVTVTAVEQQRGGFTLHDFLDAVDDLDRRDAERRAARHLRPLAGALAAAALVAVAVLVPRLEPAPPAPVSSEGGAPAELAPAGGDAEPARDGGGAPAVDRPGPRRPAPAAGPSPGTGPAPSAPAAPTPTTTGDPCPAGVPLLDVTGTRPARDGAGVVEGVVRNPGDHGVRIDAFSVTVPVAGQQLRMPGSGLPLHVPAGGEAVWSVTLPAVTAEGPPAVTLEDWQWDPPVPVTCPTP